MSICVKRGSSLVFDCAFLVDDVPMSLAGYTVTASLRRGETLVAPFAVTVTNEAGGLYTIAIIDTTAAPIGQLQFDIRYEINNIIAFTDTVGVNLTSEQTRVGDAV